MNLNAFTQAGVIETNDGDCPISMKKWVAALTLNPCVDRTLTVDRLLPGEHHTARNVQEIIAGKGIDVNVVLRHLGIPTCAVGFDFTSRGHPVGQFLEREGIPFVGRDIRAPLRVNTKIFDVSGQQMTEINCTGPTLDPSEGETCMELIRQVLPDTAILAVCGSVPPGLPADLYFRILSEARRHGVRTVLDAAGALLREGVKACPDVVKPNLAELTDLTGKKPDTREESISACRALIRAGVGAVCLTLGREGALMVTGNDAWFSETLDINVRGVQGAGDSVLAGICAAMLHSPDASQWLRWGVAAAHASLIREGTLLCEEKDFRHFLPLVPIEYAE